MLYLMKYLFVIKKQENSAQFKEYFLVSLLGQNVKHLLTAH